MKKTTVHFENIEDEIKEQLSQAKDSIKICVAWFNYDSYKLVIEQLRSKGVKVELVCNLDRFSDVIESSCFDVFFPVKSYLRWGLMHHKFCIIDYKTIITGSYNWSKNAANHLENIIVMKDDFSVVKAYLHEFEDMKMLDGSYAEHRLRKSSRFICEQYNSLTGRKCSSTLIYMVVGSLDESDNPRFGLWEVCLKNAHANLVEEFTETITNDEPQYEREDDYYDESDMLREFNTERAVISHNLFHNGKLNNYPVHALAYVEVTNWGEHYKYNVPKKFNIKIYWRNILYRKHIPRSVDVGEIIRWAQ
jgi:hypothetical protein